VTLCQILYVPIDDLAIALWLLLFTTNFALEILVILCGTLVVSAPSHNFYYNQLCNCNCDYNLQLIGRVGWEEDEKWVLISYVH